jgi:hypothetical protein
VWPVEHAQLAVRDNTTEVIKGKSCTKVVSSTILFLRKASDLKREITYTGNVHVSIQVPENEGAGHTGVRRTNTVERNSIMKC